MSDTTTSEEPTTRPPAAAHVAEGPQVAAPHVKDAWDKWESFAKIFSFIAIPLIAVAGGYVIQSILKEEENKIRTLEMALDILRAPVEDTGITPLRGWAVRVFSKSSSVPLSEDEREQLLREGLPQQVPAGVRSWETQFVGGVSDTFELVGGKKLTITEITQEPPSVGYTLDGETGILESDKPRNVTAGKYVCTLSLDNVFRQQASFTEDCTASVSMFNVLQMLYNNIPIEDIFTFPRKLALPENRKPTPEQNGQAEKPGTQPPE